MAEKPLPVLGAGACCGFGREPPATTMPMILDEHVKAATGGP